MLMWGVDARNALGSGKRPSATRYDQNWRETWNCSLTATAFEMSIEPSGSCGV